jgi:predicted ATPase/DNA-binding winged helix-turn-helix (wHTH) protein
VSGGSEPLQTPTIELHSQLSREYAATPGKGLDAMSDLPVLSFGDFELSMRRRVLSRAGQRLRVGSRAMDILLLLASRPGELVTKDEIQQRLWPGIFVDEASVRVHMSSLRKVLGADGVDHIHTVAGRGYMFVSEVTRASEPEPRTAAHAHPHLPTRLERLIGRASVVEGVAAQVLERRFVTIVGPGGIGKTSVALEVAARLADDFADGVRFVDLATLEDPEAAPGVFAIALGLPVLSELSPAALAKPLAGKRLLIVLDNCERLAGQAASVAEALLRSAPGVGVLATSREALRAEGEWLHRLPPLATPAAAQTSPAAALRYSAVELFVDRADAATGGYRLSADDCACVVEICRRLDGLPLAIELAATTIPTLGVRGIAEGLDDRLAMLTGGRRTAQSRHQTLRAALDWSYDLLSRPEQAALDSLSVIAGGFDLTVACDVATFPGQTTEEVRGLVGALAAKSLIAVETGGRDVRYRLLESTRAYAGEKLLASGAQGAVMRRYADATHAFFRDAGARWSEIGSHAWLALHASRLEDARAALEWAFSDAGDRHLARAMTAELSGFWLHLGLVRECMSWCRKALARPDGAEPVVDVYEMRIQHAFGVAQGAIYGADLKNRAAISATIELADRLGDHDYKIRGLWALATLELNGELEAALGHARDLRDAASGKDAVAERLVGERMMGCVLHLLGRHAEGRVMLEQAQAAYAIPGQRASALRFQFDQLVLAQGFLAWIAWIEGDDQASQRIARQAVDEAVRVDHAGSLGFALDVSVTLAVLRGDFAEAEVACQRLGELGANVGSDVWKARSRVMRAFLQVRSGDLTGGLPALQAALAPPVWKHLTYRTPLFLAELAQAEAAAGQLEQARITVDEAIGLFNGGDAFWCAPECFRVKADLLRRCGGAGAAQEAQALIDRAGRIADDHGAVAWKRKIASLATL